MLDELVRTIEKLQERIRTHREPIGRFEHRTRASLIDPLLCALGWEVGDPAQVTLEKQVDGPGRPDYALLGTIGKPVLLIEAKKLAATRTRELMGQLYSYIAGENHNKDYKVPFGAWTNGDVWQVIDISANNTVLETQLSDNRPADCAFQLLGLWRDSLVDGIRRTPVKLSAERSRGTEDGASDAPPLAGRAGRARSSRLPVSAIPASVASGVPLPDVRYGKGKGKPRCLVFPDTTRKDVSKSWASVQTATAEWLIDNSHVKSLPLCNERGTHLLHRSPTGKNGKQFRQYTEVRKDHFINTNLDPAGHLRKARELLSSCHVDPKDVRIEL